MRLPSCEPLSAIPDASNALRRELHNSNSRARLAAYGRAAPVAATTQSSQASSRSRSICRTTHAATGWSASTAPASPRQKIGPIVAPRDVRQFVQQDVIQFRGSQVAEQSFGQHDGGMLESDCDRHRHGARNQQSGRPADGACHHPGIEVGLLFPRGWASAVLQMAQMKITADQTGALSRKERKPHREKQRGPGSGGQRHLRRFVPDERARNGCSYTVGRCTMQRQARTCRTRNRTLRRQLAQTSDYRQENHERQHGPPDGLPVAAFMRGVQRSTAHASRAIAPVCHSVFRNASRMIFIVPPRRAARVCGAIPCGLVPRLPED